MMKPIQTEAERAALRAKLRILPSPKGQHLAMEKPSLVGWGC